MTGMEPEKFIQFIDQAVAKTQELERIRNEQQANSIRNAAKRNTFDAKRSALIDDLASKNTKVLQLENDLEIKRGLRKGIQDPAAAAAADQEIIKLENQLTIEEARLEVAQKDVGFKTQILDILEKAYNIAISGRPGPVWIDIPLDIQGAIIENDYIESLTHLINEAKKPLVIVGNGVRLSDSYKSLNDFLLKTKIPVVTGPHSGVDAVDNTYEYYSGRIGILGQLSSNKIVQEADLLIVLGSRLPVKMTGYNLKDFSPNSKKIYVDIDVNEINKHTFNIDLPIVKDLKSFFNDIKDISFTYNISDWHLKVKKYRNSQEYVHPKHKALKDYASFYYLINKAPKIFGDTPIITSNGTAHVITLQTYQLNKDQRLFTNVGCSSMGYGLPAAIGACMGNNKQPVICIEGDGSIMMNLQELETIKGYNLPVKIIIINNEGYLSIKLSQESFFKGKEFASGPKNGVTIPSFKKVAKSFDLPYMSINNNDEIEDILENMMNTKGPCVVEVFTHPKERHEPKVTHKGVGKDGKIIPGTLTDMYISDTF